MGTKLAVGAGSGPEEADVSVGSVATSFTIFAFLCFVFSFNRPEGKFSSTLRLFTEDIVVRVRDGLVLKGRKKVGLDEVKDKNYLIAYRARFSDWRRKTFGTFCPSKINLSFFSPDHHTTYKTQQWHEEEQKSVRMWAQTTALLVEEELSRRNLQMRQRVWSFELELEKSDPVSVSW